MSTETTPDQSPTIAALAAALAKAQGEMAGAKKDSLNPHFKSSYADLASAWEACRSALSKNGLAVIQRVFDHQAGVGVRTMLVHSSGEWIQQEMVVPVAQRTAQGIGSSITYGRRYALMAMVGVAPEDDDGNEASGVTPQPGVKEAPRQQAAKVSRTAEAKEQLKAKTTTQAVLWARVVDIGAMYGKTEDQLKTFARTVLGGSRAITEEDISTIHDALAATHKPIVGSPNGVHAEPDA